MDGASPRRVRGRRGLALIAALILGAGGCGTSGEVAASRPVAAAGPTSDLPLDPPPGTSPQTAAALAVWRDLPVDAELRPIVMSGSDAYSGTSYTMVEGLRFTDPTNLPEGPANAAGHPLIDARAALAIMHRDAKDFPRGSRRVEVTGVRLDTARFWTDRGLQRLPAWIVDYRNLWKAGVRGPATGTTRVLAVDPAARYGPVGRDDAAVRVSSDGLTLLVSRSLQGPLTGPCRMTFTTGVVETRGAVAYRAEPRRVDPAADCPKYDPWFGHASPGVAEVRLHHPLGNRVVVAVVGENASWFPFPVIACGGQTWVETPLCEEPPGATFSPAESIDPATLERWADFDADADPRPLVFFGSGIQTPDFLGGADEKAYAAGRWDLPPRLPTSPAEADGLPVITADAALSTLRGGRPISGTETGGRRVRLTDMRLGESTFQTDRGRRVLPAWIVHFRGSASFTSTAIVPAVAAPARYHYLERNGWSSITGVRLGSNGRNLTVLFQAARTVDGSCDREFELGRAESDHAVALEIVRVRRAPGVDSDPSTTCKSLGGSSYSITIPLAAPLGGRVVVSDVGAGPIGLLEPAHRKG